MEEQVVQLYTQEFLSMSKIAKELGISPARVKRILIKNNIEVRSNNFYKTKEVDYDFFSKIDAEEKAYVLGFMYADGYISGKYVGFKQSVKDREILEKIRNALKSQHKIGEYINNSGYGQGNTYCSFAISSEKMVSDLEKLGVLYNKSKILEFPTCEQVPEELLRHFVRGYFDGDGSIYHTTQGDSFGISFVGTESFLTGILDFFQRNGVNTTALVHKYKDKDIYDYKVGGRDNVKKIRELFYNGATIFMDRKKKVFDEA